MAYAQHHDDLYEESTEVETRVDQTETEQRLCEQCEQEKPIKAFCVECQEYLCEECTVYHCRPSRMRYHRLLKENEMPRKIATVSEYCDKHPDEINKFYCESHDECCCPVCAITFHKKCELKALTDITKNYLTSAEYDESKKNLVLLDKLVRSQIENIEKRLELGDKSVNAALEELTKHRNKINTHFDQLEKDIKSKVLDVQIENSTKMKTLSQSCKAMLTNIEEMKDDLSVLEDTKQEKLLFAAVKANEKPTEQIKTSIEKMEVDTVVRQVRYCKNRISNSMTIRKDLFGYLQVFVEERENEKGNELKESKYNEEKEVSTEIIKEDKKEIAKEIDDASANEPEGSCKNCEAGNTHFNCPFYTDFGDVPKPLQMSTKYGVILEHCKSKISVYSDDSIKPSNTNIIFSTGPWDMDKVAENSIAVTMPHEKKIKFLHVDENEIVEVDEIPTHGFCRCIAAADDNLVVTFSEPTEIKLMDHSGKVHRNFMSNIDGTTIPFQTPSSLAVVDSHIFVTDPNMRTIIRMHLVDQENTRRKLKKFKPSYICYSNKKLLVSPCGKHIIPAKMSCDLKIKIKKPPKRSDDDEIINLVDVRVFSNDIMYFSSFTKHDTSDAVDDEDDDEEENDEDDTNDVEKSSDGF